MMAALTAWRTWRYERIAADCGPAYDGWSALRSIGRYEQRRPVGIRFAERRVVIV